MKFSDEFPPIITGPRLMDVTHQTGSSFRIQAFSSLTTNLTYSLTTSNPAAFELDRRTGAFSFTPRYSNESVIFNVIDHLGNAGVFSPKLEYCYCLNGGKCLDGKFYNRKLFFLDFFIGQRKCETKVTNSFWSAEARGSEFHTIQILIDRTLKKFELAISDIPLVKNHAHYIFLYVF